MRIALFSDIHANLEAFKVVINDIERQKIDKKVFLGDIVGYGPNPNECIELLKETADTVLGGNHDWGAVGLTDVSYFNPYAKESMDWTIEQLTDENKEYLKTLKPELVEDGIQLAHSSPFEPEEWHYVSSMQDSHDNYPFITEDVCFIGHSHQPVIIEYIDGTNIMPIRDMYKTLADNRKYLINAGSVGQSRDSNPDACYVTYDTATRVINYRRIEYDISRVQKKMKKAKLPKYLIDRLEIGR